MTTESNQTLVLLFSEKASKHYKTFKLKANDEIHHYNYITGPENVTGRPPVIPYFHDAVVVAKIDESDIELMRGSNERPKMDQLVRSESPVKTAFYGPFEERPAPKPLMPKGFM